MPAHGSAHTIGRSLKSNGVPISAKDWRANRLADGLAKLAAGRHRVRKDTMLLAAHAAAAVEHSAAKLGVVTHMANHHEVSFVHPDGASGRRWIRDSAPAA
eukprot:1236807-Karenia_brevis.AAC.1